MAWTPTEEYLRPLRDAVKAFEDCKEPGKPPWYSDERLAISWPGYTGYAAHTPIPAWPAKKKLWYWRTLQAQARLKLERAIHGPVTTKRKRVQRESVTTKGYTRHQPNPKTYSSNAERQAAYRDRLRRNRKVEGSNHGKEKTK